MKSVIIVIHYSCLVLLSSMYVVFYQNARMTKFLLFLCAKIIMIY